MEPMVEWDNGSVGEKVTLVMLLQLNIVVIVAAAAVIVAADGQLLSTADFINFPSSLGWHTKRKQSKKKKSEKYEEKNEEKSEK